MTTEDDLVTWLRAQIADLRWAALTALRGYPFPTPEPSKYDTHHWHSHWDALYQAPGRDNYVGGRQIADFPQSPYAATFAARFDPAAALAQCESHEAILREHNVWAEVFPGDMEGIDPLDRHCIGCGFNALEQERTKDVNDCPTLRAVALAYRHRPGYRQEWRP